MSLVIDDEDTAILTLMGVDLEAMGERYPDWAFVTNSHIGGKPYMWLRDAERTLHLVCPIWDAARTPEVLADGRIRLAVSEDEEGAPGVVSGSP